MTFVLQGNALCLPIPDESVDLIITSPPYFALRSYQDDGTHYDGQIGSEPTPQDFLEALWAATREMVRVLKPTGSIFVNLGDKYAGSGGHNNSGLGKKQTYGTNWRPNDRAIKAATRRNAPDRYNQETGGVRAKSLMGLPWRYAIGCIDQLGLILRAEIVWSKPNGLPESVTDRPRRSHEQWFMFTKEGRYFAAVDEIREPHAPTSHSRAQYPDEHERKDIPGLRGTVASDGRWRAKEVALNPLGKLPDSVWSIPSSPLVVPDYFVRDERGASWFVFAGKPRKVKPKDGAGLFEPGARVSIFPGLAALWHEAERRYRAGERYLRVFTYDHFAAFPTEWPRRLILGFSPNGVCVECGTGRRPVVSKVLIDSGRVNRRTSPGAKRDRQDMVNDRGFNGQDYPHGTAEATITGYACACPEPTAETTPAVILDPFGGTGTVALVARTLGRVGISVDLSHDYCELARWRIFESGHGAKAATRTNKERQSSLLGQS